MPEVSNNVQRRIRAEGGDQRARGRRQVRRGCLPTSPDVPGRDDRARVPPGRRHDRGGEGAGKSALPIGLSRRHSRRVALNSPATSCDTATADPSLTVRCCLRRGTTGPQTLMRTRGASVGQRWRRSNTSVKSVARRDEQMGSDMARQRWSWPSLASRVESTDCGAKTERSPLLAKRQPAVLTLTLRMRGGSAYTNRSTITSPKSAGQLMVPPFGTVAWLRAAAMAAGGKVADPADEPTG
jgi:hypothetical protein